MDSLVTSRGTQGRILDVLRDLVAARGPDVVVTRRLWVPTNEDFPDDWSPDEAGARRLLRRIMHDVGLGALDLEVEGVVLGADARDEGSAARQFAAYFRGIVDGRCLFGVNVVELADPEMLIGVFAHEVAHAFRKHHRLLVDDEDVEEELTDLTALFSGYGIFVCNNAYQRRASMSGGKTSRGGYLSAEVMAFGLAAWLGARDFREDELALARRYLAPRQRTAFDAACKGLRGIDVARRIGLERTASLRLPDRLPAQHDERARDLEPIDFSAARASTFRLVRRRSLLGATLGTITASFVMATLHLDSLDWKLAVLGAAWIVGFVVGRYWRRDDCALRECGATIPRGVAHCPKCGALVEGEIMKEHELEDALETLRKSRIARRKARRASRAAS